MKIDGRESNQHDASCLAERPNLSTKRNYLYEKRVSATNRKPVVESIGSKSTYRQRRNVVRRSQQACLRC